MEDIWKRRSAGRGGGRILHRAVEGQDVASWTAADQDVEEVVSRVGGVSCMIKWVEVRRRGKMR